MSYCTDKLMIDGQTHAHTHTHAGNDNTRRPKLASGNKTPVNAQSISILFHNIGGMDQIKRTI